jgi:tetratricopeptide (TPR) repeat protein
LIGIVIGVEIPDTDQTRQLEERFRRPRLNEAVQELLARLLRVPMLLTIEDAHWMDEPSADLLRYLASRIRGLPWLICVTRRDVDEGFSASSGVTSQSIRLQPLDAGTAAELVAAETGDSPFAPHQIAALAERSGGNPLFLKELLSAARTAGIETLPDSIEALIMARIDRLAAPERNLLRRASVLGRSFPQDLLGAVLDEVPTAGELVWQQLSEFITVENGTMSFVHALIRDGAYEGLPYRLRRTLHAQVGDSIERTSTGQAPEERAELLSMHFFHAQRYMEALRYSLAAAERAKAIYAYVEAAEFYERALNAARRVPDLDRLETARINEALGDVRDRMGAYLEAEKAYKIVRRMVKGDPLAEARLQLKLSLVEGWLRRSQSRAIRSITKGLRILREMTDPEASAARAQLMVAYAQFCQDGGRHADAIKWSHRAIQEAEKAGQKQALADAYRQLDWANISLGKFELAKYSRKALVLYEELGDLRGQAWVLNNLGAFDYWKGRWDDAVALYQRAQKMQERIGDAVAAGFGTANIAEILSMRGQFEEAEGLLRSALRVFQSEGLRPRVAYVKGDLGIVAARLHRFDEALRLLNEAREELIDTGAETIARETDAKIAEYYLLKGDPEHALILADATLERALAQGGVAADVPMLWRARGYALTQMGRLDEAKAALDESLLAGRSRNADYEIALTLRASGQLADVRGEPFPESSRIESEEIIRRLGIVRLPEIPLAAYATTP